MLLLTEKEFIRTYAACDMNAEETAKQLPIYGDYIPIVRYYLNKIEKKTGINPRTSDGLKELLSLIDKEEKVNDPV